MRATGLFAYFSKRTRGISSRCGSGTLLAHVVTARTGRRSLGLLLALRAVSAPGPHSSSAPPRTASAAKTSWLLRVPLVIFLGRSGCPHTKSSLATRPLFPARRSRYLFDGRFRLDRTRRWRIFLVDQPGILEIQETQLVTRAPVLVDPLLAPRAARLAANNMRRATPARKIQHLRVRHAHEQSGRGKRSRREPRVHGFPFLAIVALPIHLSGVRDQRLLLLCRARSIAVHNPLGIHAFVDGFVLRG